VTIIDRDRVEEHNVSTQVYGEADVGAFKAEVMRNRLFRSVGARSRRSRRNSTPAPPAVC
jgi:molybdopterin/thiamine biosynthesis adenylyltransferase